MVDRHARESGSGYRTLAREAKVVRWDEWKFFMQWRPEMTAACGLAL